MDSIIVLCSRLYDGRRSRRQFIRGKSEIKKNSYLSSKKYAFFSAIKNDSAAEIISLLSRPYYADIIVLKLFEQLRGLLHGRT